MPPFGGRPSPTMKRILLGLLLCSAGCATGPRDVEGAREVVLQYLGGNFGTAGPFSRDGKKELDVLAPADRTQAAALLDQGAVAFLAYQAGATTRVVLVAKGRIVGDFRASAP